MKNKVTIYVLKDDDTPFYVGQSRDLKKRKAMHIRESYRLLTTKDKKIQEILGAGRSLNIEPIYECDAKVALEEERKTIQQYLIAKGINLINIVHNNSELLSSIERDVLLLMAEDCDTMDLATKLYRSPRTIETIRQRIKEKANVKTINGLMIWGINNGYISI